MHPGEQAIESNETGAAAEDAIEPRPQREAAAFLRVGSIRLEIGVEVLDQSADTLLGGSVVIGEGVQLVHQPFGMRPAQRVAAHGELPSTVAQHHGIAEEVVRMDAAPDRPFSGHLHWVRCRGEPGEAEPIEVCLPRGLVGKGRAGLLRQSGNQRGR